MYNNVHDLTDLTLYFIYLDVTQNAASFKTAVSVATNRFYKYSIAAVSTFVNDYYLQSM